MRIRTLLAAVVLSAWFVSGAPILAAAQDTPDDPPVFASVSTSASTPVLAAAPALALADAPSVEAREAGSREWFGSGRRWADWSRATGDWGTWRNRLEARGVSVTLGTTTGGSQPLASMGFSPSIFPFPTYPDPQPGIVVQTTPTAWSCIGAGVYDGGRALELDRFHAVFAISEAGLRWSRAGGGRVGIGAWHTRSVGRNAGPDTAATSGQYAVLDQAVWLDGADAGTRRIGAFARIGLADRHVSPVARHIGAGVVASGVVPRRPNDSVGVSVTAVAFGLSPECPGSGMRETNVGAFYGWRLTGWLVLKPDVQWIIHPVGDPTRVSAVVATLRLDVGF